MSHPVARIALLLAVTLPLTGYAISAPFRVMNYNIFGLPFPFSIDGGRLAKIGGVLRERAVAGSGPAVIGFQEGFRKSSSTLVDAAQFAKFLPGPPRSGTPLSSGLFSLSQLAPIVTHERYFSVCGSWDCGNSKGMQHFRVIEPQSGALIDVYNTHFQSDPYNNPFFTVKKSTEIRTKQTRDLLQFVEDTKDPQSIVLIIGDFNFTTQEEGFKLITARGFQSALVSCLEDACAGDATTTDLTSAIDHQFVLNQPGARKMAPTEYRRVFHAEDYDGKFLSDHLAVEVSYWIF